MTLSVSALSVTRAGRRILQPTSLTINLGERVGLVGASGSGKSTLGHALTDHLRTNGVAVAHVPQSPEEALDPFKTLEFHWREAERALGRAPDLAERQRLLMALGLDGANIHLRPWAWSRGMQQRFVIAMAFIGLPELLIMDEPTSALDPVIAASTMILLEQFLEGKPTALLLITHDLALASRRVNRLLVMDQGQIVEDAETSVLLASPASPAACALVAHRSWAVLPS